jgi:anti-anti-sigma regulatory factor
MEQTQTSITQDEGILIVSCVGTLDEKTAPPIFGSMLKYAKESSQIAIFDLSMTEGIKTAFITGVIEITKYIQASGGGVLVVPGKMGDILEITGIHALTKIIPTLEEAKTYAKEHFPQIIDFIREQKSKQEISSAQKVSESVDLENWKFFSDEEKNHLDIESVLNYSIATRASDIHLAVENPITYRIQ